MPEVSWLLEHVRLRVDPLKDAAGSPFGWADPVTEEEELLWSRQVLGADTALNLNLTVFYLISQQFGTRGCQEHHQLRVEQPLYWYH